MTDTIETFRADLDRLNADFAKFLEDSKRPNFFEFNGERINLNKGEIYIGTIITPGEHGSYHLILLPGEAESINWKEATAWAQKSGGELPNRVESALLFQTHKSEFSENWYWTRETHVNDSAYAWCQGFNYGGQYGAHKGLYYRARAVRRLILQ